jgi:hypothetical protein
VLAWELAEPTKRAAFRGEEQSGCSSSSPPVTAAGAAGVTVVVTVGAISVTAATAILLDADVALVERVAELGVVELAHRVAHLVGGGEVNLAHQLAALANHLRRRLRVPG